MSSSGGADLGRLLSYLDHDPDNLALIGDCAQAARDGGRADLAQELLARYEMTAPLPPALVNLKGLMALDAGRYTDAVDQFEIVLANEPGDPGARFNLAWARAMLGDWPQVDEMLDDDMVGVGVKPAVLKLQALHHLGREEDALAFGQGLAERYPGDQSLMAALALVALDADEPELARGYALGAPDTHEGASTLGMLLLAEDRFDEALPIFDKAMAVRSDSARARLGRGLTYLSQGESAAAARDLDQGAEAFGSHLGSWVAAGWAHFIAGDSGVARQRFERALNLDDTFAESHGGLAVLDLMEGDIASARRRCEIALRLDRACLSGILAKSLLLTLDGDPSAGARLREIALNAPVEPGGRSLAQAMASLASWIRP